MKTYVQLEPTDINLIEARLSLLEQNVVSIKEKIAMLAQSLQEMTREVAETRGAMASAVVLITGFASRLAVVEAELAAVGVHSLALDALRVDLDTGSTELADAVAANPIAPPAQ